MGTFLDRFIKLFKGETNIPNSNAKSWREAASSNNATFKLVSNKDNIMALIKNGRYDEIKKYVSKDLTGGFLDLIPKTVEGIMKESCMNLGLDETARIELASIIAYRAIYSHRSEFIADEFIKKVEEKGIKLDFPKDLIKYMESNPRKKKYNLKDIIQIYIRYYITKNQSKAQLEQYKELGIKKVKIRTCKDTRVCNKCKKHDGVTHLVSKAPLLPLCWSCRCYYEPQLK